VSSFDLLSKYMLITELRFDTICTLYWVTKIMVRAVSNVHASRIWPAGRRFPTPGLETHYICIVKPEFSILHWFHLMFGNHTKFVLPRSDSR